MCGITGFVSLGKKILEADLIYMTACLRHRGPDADGVFMDDTKQVGLGHRRLSILDLSDAAKQPMDSACGRYVIAFNGEIYNYKEIARELEAEFAGLKFKTTSDTEVILEAFVHKGTSFFARLNGMFAIAIYDRKTEKLTVCRDHVGIKPLYYYWDGTSFVFSSELKSLKQFKELKLQVNTTAISYFLHLGYIPEPLTIYHNVFKFPAAHYLEVSKDATELDFKPFWKLEDRIVSEPLKNEGTAKQKLRELLFDSVEKQLVSDVPIGTFLSGGIDSSIVTAIASKVSSTKVKTFNIGFEDSMFDESNYASAVSKHLNTEHYFLRVTEKDALDLVPQLLDVYDEPFSDSSAFPTMLVSKLAREHVTVALSGDGGDELFLGYGMYQWARRLHNPVIRFLRKPVGAGMSLMNERFKRAAGVLDYPKGRHLKSHIFSQEQKFFSEPELQELLLIDREFDFSELNQSMSVPRVLDPYEQQSFWDITHYLKDDLLVKVDRASMKYSLESRVPLLDFRLIEFAVNLDSGLKFKGNESKYLLKEVLYEMVPKQIFERPKRGFGIPLHHWLKGDLRFLMEKYTSREVLENYSLVNYKEVQLLKDRYLRGENYLYNRLWVVILLHWWLEENT